MKRIAVIDIGSNSFHMIICEVSENDFNPIKIVNDNDYKAYVRLGANLQQGDCIKLEKIQEIMTVLTRFQHVAMSNKVSKIFCVATEALRRAANGQEIIQRIKEQIGIEVELISGQQEAYLGYYSLVNGFALDNYLMVDIGGSSTELVYVSNREMKQSISLPVGSLNICDRFQSTNMIDNQLLVKMTQSFTTLLDSVEWLKDLEIDAIIGVGGTMRTIGKYDRARKRYPLSIQHNYSLTFERVQAIFEELRMLTEQERLDAEGLPKKRAAIFPSALLFVITIMNYVQNKQLILSKHGLREGVVWDYLLKGAVCENILERDIEQLLNEHALSGRYQQRFAEVFTACQSMLTTEEVDVIKLATFFNLKKQYSDGKQTKKFLKYLFSRGVFGVTHQQMMMALLIADYNVDDKYKRILTDSDHAFVLRMKSLNLFRE
ncbi:Ppx/GppA family phosphatase [Peribacillus asahii]|uniref:Ppx/GppA family phosphatase n=1 Tax=Peribacillus asahii TaxID=228899 RepID=A0A398BBM0_9BACI|nr:Ppx/GppA family phosphatase [Peribacillus asahii]RID87232.1 Ppx/GppA family phosphatase [Peribacillus asahii]